MRVKRRIFVSAPRDVRLDGPRIKIKRSIIAQIEAAGFEPQAFLDEIQGTVLTDGAGWSLEDVERVIRRCAGAVLIGLPLFKTTCEDKECWLPTDYCQYEGAIAHAHGLPILAISIGVERRILFDEHARVYSISIPLQEDLSWLPSPAFRGPFASWQRAVEQRWDVFLGYCSKSVGTAAQIQVRLEREGASVLNYALDFRAGSSILEEVAKACARSACGVFLFSEDDPLEGGSGGAAPRDNVVFEAGYFMSAKGPERCLIVRQGDAKMPADIGGAIYAHLATGADISSIEGRLRDFVERNL